MAKRRNIPRLGSKARPRIYGTGDELDYLPFNPDYRPRNHTVRRIFDQFGIEAWRDLFIPNRPPYGGLQGYARGVPYTTPNEAIAYAMKDGGSLLAVGLLRIYYDPNTNMYFAYVMDSS